MSWAEEMSAKYMEDLKKAKEFHQKVAKEYQEKKRLADERMVEQLLAARFSDLVAFVNMCQLLHMPDGEHTIYEYVRQQMAVDTDREL